MEKILISACLVGDKTKYDGRSNYTPLVKQLMERYELVPFCPEVEGGLTTPRLPSEIAKNSGRVIRSDGKDVTYNYDKGAERAWNVCKYLGIRIAILKENSPSCGVHNVYDGTFSHKLIDGQGNTTKYLKSKGITVYSENEIEEFLLTK